MIGIQSYQDYFLQFNWFQPLLIGLAGLLILIGLILVLSILNLRIANLDFIKTFDDGHIYVSRKAVEKQFTIQSLNMIKLDNQML